VAQWRLLLDENTSSRVVADALEKEGHEVALPQHRGLTGYEDWKLLQWCYERDHVLITKNRGDFRKLHEEWRGKTRLHCGIIVVPDYKAQQIADLLIGYLACTDPGSVANELVPLEQWPRPEPAAPPSCISSGHGTH
jgi:predicted nuclease of predicted toxin-antitoxin system